MRSFIWRHFIWSGPQAELANSMLRNATVQEEAGARVAQAVPGNKGKRPFQVIIEICLGGRVPGGSGEGME